MFKLMESTCNYSFEGRNNNNSKAQPQVKKAKFHTPSSSNYKLRNTPSSSPSKWLNLELSGDDFVPRTGHAVASFNSKDKSTIEYKTIDSSKVAFLSTQSLTNSELSTVPYLPPGVNKHIFSFLELELTKKLYVFGGTSNIERLQDFFELDILTGKWKKIENDVSSSSTTSTTSLSNNSTTPALLNSTINSSLETPVVPVVPNRRSGAKAQYIDGKIYLFGGYDGRGGKYYNDLWSFNILNEHKFWKLETLSPHQAVPSARTDHTLVTYRSKYLVLFGGFDGIYKFNDLHYYDPDLSMWKAIQAKGEIPSKRFGHTAVCNEDFMYVFGGWDGYATLSDLYTFHFSTSTWTKVDLNSPAPPHRYRHTATLKDNLMFVFGGVDQSHNRFNDLQCYNILTRSWKALTVTGNVSSRSFHSTVNFEDKIYVLGGFDGGERLNDVKYCSIEGSFDHLEDEIKKFKVENNVKYNLESPSSSSSSCPQESTEDEMEID